MRSQQVFVFDLDGTLYRGNEPIPGAIEVVNRLAEAGKSVVYLTNNSSKTVQEYLDKLGEMGFLCSSNQIVSSATATANYLVQNSIQSAFVVGEPGLEQTLAESGIDVLSDAPQAVVVGICRTRLSYDLLDQALQHILKGSKFIATNRDATYPLEGDRLSPGAGTMVAALQTCSGVEPFVVGKPNPYILTEWLSRNGFQPEQAIMIGDRLDTDIECARRAGVKPVLVLTGVAKAEEPGIETLHSVADLL